MKFKDQLSFVRKNMKKNKLRLFMTILATTIGCAFLIILASLGFGLQASIQKNILMDNDVTKIQVHGKKEGEQPVAEDEAAKMKDIADVKAVSYQKHWNVPFAVSLENRTGNVQFITMNSKEEKAAGFKLSQGRMPQAENEVIVGYSFAKALLTEEEQKKLSEEVKEGEDLPQPEGYKGDLLSKTITLTVSKLKDGEEEKKDYTVQIVGVGPKPSREWAQDQTVYMGEQIESSLELFLKDSDEAKQMGEVSSPEVQVYATSVEKVKGISSTLKKQGYMVYSVTDELEEFNTFFLLVKIGLIFVGTIAVLIASIGIFNTMTMAVTERTQEIGIMKAIGAQPSVIRTIFILESAWIGLVGAVFAILISYAFSFAANALIPLLLKQFANTEAPKDFMFSSIPPSLVLIAVAISLTVALLSGVRPAAKATRTNVLSALRRDL